MLPAYHCRGCSLSVWVASSIKAIQVVDEGSVWVASSIKAIQVVDEGRRVQSR